MSSVAVLRRPPSFDRGVRSRSAASALGAFALAMAGLAGAWSLDGRLGAARLSLVVTPTEPVLGFLLEPTPMFTAVAGAPALTGFNSVPVAVAVASAAAEAGAGASAPQDERAVLPPFPPPRPLDLAPALPTVLPHLAERASRLSHPVAELPATPSNDHGFFERLFGLNRPASVARAADPTPDAAGPVAALPPPQEQAALAPFPQPRPLDLARAMPTTPVRERVRPGRTRAEPAATPVDNRGFFERLFGLNKPAGGTVALAYAPAETTSVGRSLGLSSGFPGTGGGTAVYDIAAHTVTLPDGRRLEAHSGLGDHLDDPGSVHLRMRGATPPHTYELSLREKLFHGVRALRLTPVGEGHIYGRDGLLAHTYMLGPNGQSNGCVSFRDYQAFLQAFERGDVKRLVVVGRS